MKNDSDGQKRAFILEVQPETLFVLVEKYVSTQNKSDPMRLRCVVDFSDTTESFSLKNSYNSVFETFTTFRPSLKPVQNGNGDT